jgi:hypothetical protein
VKLSQEVRRHNYKLLMKSMPIQGKRQLKSKVKPVTKQGPSASNAPPDPSLVQRENEFAEVRQQARWLYEHGDEYRTRLLQNIKQRLPQLDELLVKAEHSFEMEDGVYRFYHQSFKVYGLQKLTEQICKALQELLPDRPMNKWFAEIIAQGTGRQFELSHNEDWLRNTRPILEAVFHAHYFLKMACKYGRELETSPNMLPFGWAAVLYLFDLR